MEQTDTTLDIGALNEKIENESAFIDILSMEMNKVIVGQKHMVERLLIGLLGGGTYFAGRGTWIGKNFGDKHPCKSCSWRF